MKLLKVPDLTKWIFYEKENEFQRRIDRYNEAKKNGTLDEKYPVIGSLANIEEIVEIIKRKLNEGG